MLDPEFDENREDINSSVQRFEKMLNNQEDSFFDIDTLEQIADHYFMQSKFDEALQACDLGLTHFPYTLELIILKAQVLGEKGTRLRRNRRRWMRFGQKIGRT